jgi:predicted anti-sigma-YlaC factor YlaD
MVTCKTIIGQLSDYLDGNVSVEMKDKIERHLRGCRRCSAVYDSTRKMLVIMGDEEVFEVPGGYGTRLHSFVDSLVARAKSN